MLASKRFVTVMLALGMGFSAQTFAEEQQTGQQTEGQTTMKVEDASKGVQKSQGDLDQEITNARMRATDGSKSKFSMSSTLGGNFGSVERPFGQVRPDIYGNPENETRTSIGGSISARYRFNKNHSATVGTGISLMTPFQGDVDAERNQLDIDNPSLGYTFSGKLGAFQAQTSASVSFGTSEAYKNQELLNYASISQNMLTTFLDDKLSVGASVALGVFNYGNESQGAGDLRGAYDLGLYPYAEYTLNDTYSLRTVFGYFNFEHVRGTEDKSLFKMDKSVSYQSIGVGCSVTRDIYLYPNIQFLPEEMEAKKTNVALSATINVS